MGAAEPVRARIGGAGDRAGGGDDRVRPPARRTERGADPRTRRQVVQQREQLRAAAGCAGGREQRALPRRDHQGRAARADESRDVGAQAREVAQRAGGPPAQRERPAGERLDAESGACGRAGERTGRARERDRSVERAQPVEQDALGAPEQAGRGDREHAAAAHPRTARVSACSWRSGRRASPPSSAWPAARDANVSACAASSSASARRPRVAPTTARRRRASRS